MLIKKKIKKISAITANPISEIIGEGTKKIVTDNLIPTISTATGLCLGGVPGFVVTTVLGVLMKDFSARQLSFIETTRINKLIALANIKYKQALNNGFQPRTDLDQKLVKEFCEGILLKAKDSYEEKKIELLANLLARAPFTSTPLENLNQTLILAESLSFKQLCIISVIHKNELENNNNLSEKQLLFEETKKLNEFIQGVYSDMFYMLSIGIFYYNVQAVVVNLRHYTGISPKTIICQYSGIALYDGLCLGEIPDDDLKLIKDALKEESLK